jgi:hypothetical protein
MDTIHNDSKLHEYYVSFTSTFSKNLIGYMTVSSGMVDPTIDNTTADIIEYLGELTPIGSIISLFSSVMKKVTEVKVTNKATRMAKMGDVTTMEGIVQNVARQFIMSE